MIIGWKCNGREQGGDVRVEGRRRTLKEKLDKEEGVVGETATDSIADNLLLLLFLSFRKKRKQDGAERGGRTSGR